MSQVKKRRIEDSGKFETRDEKSDITLIVEEKKLYVHKSVLEYSSPVFSEKFKEGTASEIPLPDIKYQAFLDFLYQIYPECDERAPIQDDTLEDMRELAEKYKVELLVKRCTDFLLEQAQEKSLTVEQTMMYLHQCHKYRHGRSLWNTFLEHAKTKDYRAVKENEHFQQLPDERRTQLLRLRCEFLEKNRESTSSAISKMEESLNELPRMEVATPTKTGWFNFSRLEFCEKCPIDRLKSELLVKLGEIKTANIPK